MREAALHATRNTQHASLITPRFTPIDSSPTSPDHSPMSDLSYPRSPRETMCGWVHLPRFIDKIRLHLAGKLPPDYQANFCKGFDGRWLELAGVDAQQFIEVVRNSITDGEV